MEQIDGDNKNMKINCFIVSDNTEILIDCESSLTIKGLKKAINEKTGMDKTYKIFHNDKDLSQCNKLSLSELFHQFLQNNLIEPIKLVIHPVVKRRLNKAKSEKKLKYMLECNLHTNENAHFYCFTCNNSFCTLCIEEHHPHDFIDKYEYSKSSEEIVSGIMEDFIISIKKMEIEKNNIFLQILSNLNQPKPSNHRKGDSSSSLLNILNPPQEQDSSALLDRSLLELKSIYSELLHNNSLILREKSLHKIEEFKQHLMKFKQICLNSLTYTQNKKITDIIVLEEEYFLEIHKTVKELNHGKSALIKYMNTLNAEYLEEKKVFQTFDAEIRNDLEKVIEKIRIKLKKEDVANISKCEEVENEKISVFDNKIKNIDINSNITSELCTEENDPQQFMSTGDVKSRHKHFFVSGISTAGSEFFSQYVMKRTLGVDKKPPEIILYNPNRKIFESRKINTKAESKFRKFLQFSVFINVENLLYISGGKKKTGKCSTEFYHFNPENNFLTKLPSMLKERCSHSMAYINPGSNNINGQIFAIGGYGNNTCERYLTFDKKWDMLPDLNSKERQVPTLFVHNNQFLICIFGYVNNYLEKEDCLERLDLTTISKWELIKLNHEENIGKYDLKIFNVGLIPLNIHEMLVLGGEHYQGEETDNVYILDMKANSIKPYEDLRLPIKSSFIDKNFVKYSAVKFAQYEMKKNSIIFFNSSKCKFKVKTF
jgi:hypothetical protein